MRRSGDKAKGREQDIVQCSYHLLVTGDGEGDWGEGRWSEWEGRCRLCVQQQRGELVDEIGQG